MFFTKGRLTRFVSLTEIIGYWQISAKILLRDEGRRNTCCGIGRLGMYMDSVQWQHALNQDLRLSISIEEKYRMTSWGIFPWVFSLE